MSNNTTTAKEVQASIQRHAIEQAAPATERPKLARKLGVWTDGKLRLQTRDREAAESAALRWMDDKRIGMVWLAPLGSFVTDQAGR